MSMGFLLAEPMPDWYCEWQVWGMSMRSGRLAAILAVDVAGYSRLMGADDEGTLAGLRAVRGELADPKIAEHRGRIVKTTGDGLLVEFASVVDAVRCAVEITVVRQRFFGIPTSTPTSSQRNTSGRAGWKRLGPVVTMRSRSLGRRVSEGYEPHPSCDDCPLTARSRPKRGAKKS
jgi:hypothetical protein